MSVGGGWVGWWGGQLVTVGLLSSLAVLSLKSALKKVLRFSSFEFRIIHKISSLSAADIPLVTQMIQLFPDVGATKSSRFASGQELHKRFLT